MNESEFNELLELSWRRPLNSVEEARLQRYLSEHPEAQRLWDSEATLSQFLADLPAAPLSSNFTARVLQALDLDLAQAARQRSRSWWRGSWPRLAWATSFLALSFLAYVQFDKHNEKELQRDIATLTTAMPAEPRVLQDFETIRRLGQAPVVDETLWVALNETTP